jgi:hypothetical protein
VSVASRPRGRLLSAALEFVGQGDLVHKAAMHGLQEVDRPDGEGTQRHREPPLLGPRASASVDGLHARAEEDDVKKFAATAIAAAILLTGLAGSSTSWYAVGASAPDRSQHVTRLVLHQIESHSPRTNRFLGVDRLRFLASHEIAGYDNFAGVFNPRNDRLRFWLDISLNGGLIDSYFDVNTAMTSFTGRITHGSGRFRGIEGTVHVRIYDSGRTVYTLRYNL